jgi:uncharacterized membrane protein required for colicin V production
MASDRVLKLVIVAVVLLFAWYAGREGVSLGIAVALVGMAAAYWRAVLGIPVAAAMTVATVYAPGVAAVAACAVVVLVLVSIFVKVTFDWGGPPPSDGLSGSDGAGLGW